MKTQLDEITEKAKADPDKYMDDYYTCFLNSMIYMLTWDAPEVEGEAEAEEGTEFEPVIIEESGDRIILLFDRKDRAQKYAEERDDLGVIGMKGFTVLKALGTQFYLVLNPKTDSEKEFSPEEIEHLLANVTEELI